jgi:rhamnulose-1-phosphate aldolase/alcohol dehydrogenase
VLWVKGSGGDLRTSKRENFSSLYQDKLLALQSTARRRRGPKTAIEDAMVGLYPHCTFNLNPRAPSIDTPLHSFVPYKHVDHMHPNSVIAVAASKNSKELTKEIFGDEVIWTPWLRPGFDLGLELEKICKENPKAEGRDPGPARPDQLGRRRQGMLRPDADADRKGGALHRRARQGREDFRRREIRGAGRSERRETLFELLPWLRGRVSQHKRFIGTVQDDEATILRFVNSHDAPRLAELGTSCPDHFLRTKIKPLYVDWNPQTEKLDDAEKEADRGIWSSTARTTQVLRKVQAAQFARDARPNPTVMLIPGLGMIAWGKDKSESRVTAEFYNCAVEVMRGAEAIDEYIALPQQEAFDIEYWLLEEAKLKRMPAEKELARNVVAGGRRGQRHRRAVAHRLAKEGAHVVCADLNLAAAEATAKELTKIYGMGIGVAGTGISGCGPAVALR